jgi:hypothetical protein
MLSSDDNIEKAHSTARVRAIAVPNSGPRTWQRCEVHVRSKRLRGPFEVQTLDVQLFCFHAKPLVSC